VLSLDDDSLMRSESPAARPAIDRIVFEKSDWMTSPACPTSEIVPTVSTPIGAARQAKLAGRVRSPRQQIDYLSADDSHFDVIS